MATISNVTDIQHFAADWVVFAFNTQPENGGTLSFTATGLPPGATLNAQSGAFTKPPMFNQAPVDYEIELTVSEVGAASVTVEFVWTILPTAFSPPATNLPLFYQFDDQGNPWPEDPQFFGLFNYYGLDTVIRPASWVARSHAMDRAGLERSLLYGETNWWLAPLQLIDSVSFFTDPFFPDFTYGTVNSSNGEGSAGANLTIYPYNVYFEARPSTETLTQTGTINAWSRTRTTTYTMALSANGYAIDVTSTTTDWNYTLGSEEDIGYREPITSTTTYGPLLDGTSLASTAIANMRQDALNGTYTPIASTRMFKGTIKYGNAMTDSFGHYDMVYGDYDVIARMPAHGWENHWSVCIGVVLYDFEEGVTRKSSETFLGAKPASFKVFTSDFDVKTSTNLKTHPDTGEQVYLMPLTDQHAIEHTPGAEFLDVGYRSDWYPFDQNDGELYYPNQESIVGFGSGYPSTYLDYNALMPSPAYETAFAEEEPPPDP